MFYILNFDNHKFISCDNASIAEANLRYLLSTGTAANSLEIVNGYSDGSRLDVHAFRNLCREQNLVDESIVTTVFPNREIAEMESANILHYKEYREITKEQANLIYDYMDPFENRSRPRLSDSGFDFLSASGKYYLREGDKFIGFDYSCDYEGFVEEFDSLEECYAWLNDEFEISELEQWRFNNRNQIEQKPTLELLIQSAKEKAFNAPDSNTNHQMTLADFLSHFDFSYEVYLNDNESENCRRKELIEDGYLDVKHLNSPLIGLIDDQSANYGNIQGSRFPMDHELTSKIIDRMNIYIEDGVVSEFVDAVESHDLNTTDLSLEDMVLICKALNIDNVSYSLAEMIISPEKIIVPELEKSIVRTNASNSNVVKDDFTH